MNFHAITDIARQRQAELRTQAAEGRLPSGRTIPRWRLSWTRTTLPGDQPSLVLIISVTRTA
jgi:hypothetical protein